MAQLTYRYTTLRTVVPKDFPMADELRKLDERSTDLPAIGGGRLRPRQHHHA